MVKAAEPLRAAEAAGTRSTSARAHLDKHLPTASHTLPAMDLLHLPVIDMQGLRVMDRLHLQVMSMQRLPAIGIEQGCKE